MNLSKIKEFKIFQILICDGLIKANRDVNDAIRILNMIFNMGLEYVLRQICVVLILLVVIPVSVTSVERVFNKMTLIKNLRLVIGRRSTVIL